MGCICSHKMRREAKLRFSLFLTSHHCEQYRLLQYVGALFVPKAILVMYLNVNLGQF